MYYDNIYLREIETPLGGMTACCTEHGIYLFDFSDKADLAQRLKHIHLSNQKIIKENHPYLELLHKEVMLYFQCQLKQFSIPIHLTGTDFQKSVWKSLIKIPYGQTISYQQQANIINKPKSVRAVANANSKNNISIIVPCHRVIGSNGSLTGYAGGLWRKEKLLTLEQFSQQI